MRTNHKFLKILQSHAGFSLEELMLVVAIMGMLASMAIPEFRRFQRKARQSEAKSILANFYSAQKITYNEMNFYPGNFSAAGFNPEGQLTYRITARNNPTGATAGSGGVPMVGYDASCITTAGSACAAGYRLWTERPAGVSYGRVGPGAPSTSCIPYTTDTLFLACAGAYLGESAVDTWSIYDNKILWNSEVGL